ncbi:hypothetical protein LTR59_009833 [Friedmanniomyces endolithicus]|nr:hypothetical protein LTR94_015797 [Friedmanniomyces endolithicus]KAK0771202.1 hypothetical protein LTR38_017314 [Friedmanniomyces endolithicus]KAK0788817.1 hypothetical protein LTR59_009833 [Friedmanniomyces endolithicus]KAK0844857.1 hypothetical protein LTR03_007852 [Friedmanniomyces endolithicus]
MSHSSNGPPSYPQSSSGLGQSLRRPSYAAVAASVTPRLVTLDQPHGSYGHHHHPAASMQARGEQQPQALGMLARPRAGSTNMSMEVDGQAGTARRGVWGGDWQGCPQHEDHPPFFTPSYLRQSRHTQRLQRAYDEHLAELHEHTRLNPPKPPPPLSASSSSGNLHKLHTSHIHHHQRPVVQDVLERHPPPSEEVDRSHPLPTRWSEEDKMAGLEIQGESGEEVRFGGATKTADEAASIRTDHAMPRECGIYYFEVTVLSRGKDGLVGIGFSTRKAALNRLPGWEAESWAYHGDDGLFFASSASGKAYGPRFASNDVIGCGVNFRTNEAFFTKNGVYLGVAFNGIRSEKHYYYPSVGMKKPGEHLRINLGRTPFVFDIDHMMEQERQVVMAKIDKTDVSSLHPPDTESTVIHKLIGQYLAHEGYVDTAKAFAKDVHDQQQSLSNNPQPFTPPDSGDDIHAINRQKIRRSILDGDIDRAMKYTSTYYPHVLEEERNRDIYFRLKCRKFIEMMRRYAELVTATSSPATAKEVDSLEGNGHADAGTRIAKQGEEQDDEDEDDEEEDDEQDDEGEEAKGQDTQMELDDQLHREASHPPPDDDSQIPTDDIDMDAPPSPHPPNKKSSYMQKDLLLTSALHYGQQLQLDFGADPRPRVKQELRELFAIIAYTDPGGSPIGGLLDPRGRAGIAEEVNGAVLVSLGQPASAALERLCAQTEAMLDETAAKSGGGAALVNVREDFLR